MSNENKAENNNLYSLIPLDDFKLILNIDDRDERLARFCLVTSTLTIEQYCKRKFLRKKYFDTVEFSGDLVIPLRAYPVNEILAVFLLINNDQLSNKNESILEPEFYRSMLGCDFNEDLPFSLLLSPSVRRFSRLFGIKVIYWAGYKKGTVPADLASACLELASWNFNRYKGRRIGVTGNIRGSGKEGEHFEMSMPDNVRQLLEPYRRKTI